MNNIIILFTIFISFASAAQTRDALYGEWKFESVADEMGANKDKKASVAGLLDGYVYIFYPDNYYEANILSIAEKGSWSLAGNEITTVASAGKPGVILEILAFEENKMKVNANGLIVNLKRTKIMSVPQVLIKKWTFAGTRVDPDDDELRAGPKNSFLELRSDGTYTAVIGSVDESGNWMYAEETRTINLSNLTTAKEWPVVTFDESSLIIRMNTSIAEFIFINP